MTDLPENPAAASSPCLICEVLSVDDAAGSAKVRFLNPDHAGGAMTLKTRMVTNPDYVEGGEEPMDVEETYEVDEDPNPHVVKSIRVPLTDDGVIDRPAWDQRLIEQARGVMERMKAAKPVEGGISIEALVSGAG